MESPRIIAVKISTSPSKLKCCNGLKNIFNKSHWLNKTHLRATLSPQVAAAAAAAAKSLQSSPTLCDPIDGSPPVSSVHGILQARILEWGAISYSRGSSRPRD